MNKICTSIEQSKKLIELGIDVNTADMSYATWTIMENGEYILSPNQGETIEELQEHYGNQIIPAWSLSALLGLLPRIEHLKPFIDLSPKSDSEGVAIYYHSEDSPYIVKDNLIDAAFEMICWLIEQGHSKVNK